MTGVQTCALPIWVWGLPGWAHPLGADQASSPYPVPQGLVGQDQGLQEQLLQLLASHDDAALVAQCALDLLLPEERLPASVAAELRQLRIQER